MTVKVWDGLGLVMLIHNLGDGCSGFDSYEQWPSVPWSSYLGFRAIRTPTIPSGIGRRVWGFHGYGAHGGYPSSELVVFFRGKMIPFSLMDDFPGGYPPMTKRKPAYGLMTILRYGKCRHAFVMGLTRGSSWAVHGVMAGNIQKNWWEDLQAG